MHNLAHYQLNIIAGWLTGYYWLSIQAELDYETAVLQENWKTGTFYWKKSSQPIVSVRAMDNMSQNALLNTLLFVFSLSRFLLQTRIHFFRRYPFSDTAVAPICKSQIAVNRKRVDSSWRSKIDIRKGCQKVSAPNCSIVRNWTKKLKFVWKIKARWRRFLKLYLIRVNWYWFCIKCYELTVFCYPDLSTVYLLSDNS